MGRKGKGGRAAAAIKAAQERADEEGEPDYGRIYGDAHDEEDLVRTEVGDFQSLREKDPGEESGEGDDDDDDTMAVLGLEGGFDEDDEDEDEDIGDDYNFERHARGEEDEEDDSEDDDDDDVNDDDVAIPEEGEEDDDDDDDDDNDTGRGPKVDLAKLRKYAEETGEELLLPSNMDYINKMAGYDEHRDIMDRKDPQAAEEAFLNRWGSSKDVFYGTNFVDHDFDHDKDELEEAKLEADEALDTQMRQAEALNEADFDALLPAAAAAKGARSAKAPAAAGVRPLDSLDTTPLKMKRDLPEMDEAEKRRHLRRALPEFARHTQFMQEQVQRLRTVLDPLMTRLRKLSLTAEQPQWADYVRFQHNLATAYTTNVLYLIYAQARGTLTRTHPCYTACSTLRSGLEATSSPSIDSRLALVLSGKGPADTVPATAAEAMEQQTPAGDGGASSDEGSGWAAKKNSKSKKTKKGKGKKQKQQKKNGARADGDDDDDENEFDLDEEALNKAAIKFYKRAEQLSKTKHKQKQERREEAVQDRLNTTEDGSRAVTRDIQRNKGLLPSRKKEYRNPRVRQKKRFQRAQKKRRARFKEAVREVPHYQGEKTGIKRTVIKSVKLH